MKVVVHALKLRSDNFDATDEYKPEGLSIRIGNQMPDPGMHYIGKYQEFF